MNVRLAILAALLLLATSCAPTQREKSPAADDTWIDYGGGLLGHRGDGFTMCYRLAGYDNLSCVRS